MSVKIEILNYRYVKSNLLTWSNNNTTGFSTTTGISAASNTSGGAGILIQSTAGVAGQFGGFQSANLILQNNHSYTFTYTCSSLGNAGQADSHVFIKGAGGGVNSYRPFGNIPIIVGTHSYTFTMDTSQNNNIGVIDVYFELTNGNLANKNVKIKNLKLFDNTILNTVDWDKSVVGELDVTDHSDFPLAMTFQISDIKDLTSTSGDYSKTFKIPATKNNNKLLKHTYTPNIDTNVNLTENKKCRILINNLFSIKGLIKVTGVGGYGETPSYYDCVFFGSNLSWADDISNKYMYELDWGVNSDNLEYNKTKIMATWQHEDCAAAAAASDPPIVYPITSYGDYNKDGTPRTIQLLDTCNGAGFGTAACVGYQGFYNSGTISYGTPDPSADWRPAVFVKDTLEKIFSGVGYSINSTFMGTSMFKKLVWLLPNFKYNNSEQRYSQYSSEATFDTTIALSEFEIENTWAVNTGASASYPLEYDSHHVDFGTINTNFTLSNDTSSTEITYVGGAEGFQIAEYGYYNIKASGFAAELSNLLQDLGAGAGPQIPPSYYPSATNRTPELTIDKIQFRLQVKTVGQTTFSDIYNVQDDNSKNFKGSPNTASVTGGGNLIDATTSFYWYLSDNLNKEGLWLNKGDRVRIAFFAKFKPHNNSGSWKGYGDWSFDVIPTIGEFDICLNSEAVAYGQTYDLDKVINKDYKQIDFVKGIAHAFNLKMTTDETTRTVNIEPFNTFYKDYADAIDWTYKLDRSKQIEDKWIKSDLKRDVVFKYKSDSKDKKVEQRGEQYFDGIKDEFPYQETLPKTFEKGESKYENPFFAGSYNGKDQDTVYFIPKDNPISACLWEANAHSSTSYRPDKGYEFLPRLLYWNKYSPTGLPNPAGNLGLQKYAAVQTWAGEVKYLNPNADFAIFGNIISNIYPQATSINADDSSSPILSYGNVNVRDYDDATTVYTSYAAGKGLFETYYYNMFEMLKVKPRLRTVYIDLKITDIINLDFTKLVYIDGVYWRINKVVDYQPNKNQPTKVELIEWFQVGAFAALAPSFGGNENTGDFGVDIPDNNDNIGL